MERTLATIVGAAVLAAALFTNEAWADEVLMDRDALRAEIDAYLAEKEAAKKPKEEKKEDGGTFKVYWKDGLRMDSADKNFKIKLTGRTQLDWTVFLDQDEDVEAATGEFHSNLGFRRARIGLDAQIYEYFAFKAEYDFTGGISDFKDVYVGTRGLHACFGCLFPDITIGHHKAPQSLEVMTSSKYLTFLERALPTVLAPERDTGVSLQRALWGDRITAHVGVYGLADNFGTSTFADDGWHATGRLTFLPWAPCDCPCRFLHLGASYSLRRDMDALRVRQRPETGFGPRIVDTGTFAVDGMDVAGAELAFVYDRFSVQGEYLHAWVDSPAGDDPDFWGWYVQASYFLTGPCRNFKRSGAVFDRIKPCENFLGKDCGGWGAWEIAARYSFLDLADGAIDGGEVRDVTVGLNWYLNPNMKVQLNYVFSDVTNAFGDPAADGGVHLFGIRFHVDW